MRLAVVAAVVVVVVVPVAAACSAPEASRSAPAPSPSASRQATPPPPAVAVRPDEPLGVLALAPRGDGPPSWLPHGDAAAVVPSGEHALAAGVARQVIDHSGRIATVATGAPESLPYGCEDNQLGVVPFRGASLAPGAVWILPDPPPRTWHPVALQIAARGGTSVRRAFEIGPIRLVLARSGDPQRGTLTFSRGDRVLATEAIERAGMAGDDAPLDLTREGPGVPAPVAAWTIGEGGPIVVALVTPGYEGIQLSGWMIERDHAREVPELGSYWYQCAF
ncbi:MAG: hypothetical protein ACTHU0_38630 [Kofleriaceae bacterium]